MTRRALVAAVFVAACARADASLAVRAVFVVPGAGLAPGAVYATIANPTAIADTLIAVEMEDGSAVMMHTESMQSVRRVFIPPRAQVRFKPGGLHGMVEHATAKLGDSLRVTFFFAKAGQIVARATVIDYAQVDSAVGRGSN